MNEINEILLSIGIAKGKEKERIIEKFKDHEEFRRVLYQVFNPYRKTNIAKKKLAKDTSVAPNKQFADFISYVDYLENECNGTDQSIANVQSYIKSSPEDVHWMLEAMATKTLKLGFSEKTINKALGEDFIPTFDVMLAEKWIDTKSSTKNGVKQSKVHLNWQRYVDKDVIATIKLDGNRFIAFVHGDGRVEFYSREGHLLEGYYELEEAFKKMPKGFVYDGEVLAINNEGMNSQELFKKTSSICRSKGEKKDLEFYGFDMLQIEEFQSGLSTMPCYKRKSYLSMVISKADESLIKYVEPLYEGKFSFEKIEELSEKAKKDGLEGIMCQIADAPYQCKRTFNILKVKSFFSADIRCLDMYEGEGENEGKLGGLILEYKGSKVRCGSGFSAFERERFWNDPSLIVGEIVEIKFFEEFIEDNEYDLRFAVFKTIRKDKSEPSYY